MVANSYASSAHRRPGLRAVGPWLRSKLGVLRSAWRAAKPVRAEDWSKAPGPARCAGLEGYVGGGSTLVQRLRWDVALRRAVIAAVGPDGKPRYRFIGDTASLVSDFRRMASLQIC